MAIEHKCKITVLECKCFNDYQEKYLADPKKRIYEEVEELTFADGRQ